MTTEQQALLLQQLFQPQSVPQKRVWIKRDTVGAVCSTPTTVQVSQNDIVDDLKSRILAKYPTTLARQVDPADLVISRSGIVLSPEENVFGILDRFFPEGAVMSVNDAFLVSVRPRQQLELLQLQQQSQHQSRVESPRPASVNEEQHQPAPHQQLQPEIDFQIPVNAESTSTSASTLTNTSANTSTNGSADTSADRYASTSTDSSSNTFTNTPTSTDTFSPTPTASADGPTKKPDSNKVSKRSRANSMKSNTGGNGVILLPRQFKNNSTVGVSGVSGGNVGNNSGSHGNRKGFSKIPLEVGRYPSPEIHHTKSGAYQRVTRPSLMNNLTPSSNGILPSSSPISTPSLQAQQDEQNHHSHNEDPEVTRRTRAVSNPGSRPKLSTVRQASQQSISRVARTNSGGRNSPLLPLTPANTNTPMNNKKLLLSINKGISPYTTVVPQVNVLIVEDNVINQKILETYLRKRKIRSSTAKNGKEAIEKWKQGGFHLVLMDIQLPVMNGIEATKKIRQLENRNRIGVFSSVNNASATTEPAVELTEDEKLDLKKFRSPVIIVALTASSSLADKSEALAAGCNDFLTKPVNLKWLEQKTIEWGCMQALIDFEGWKMWVSK
jgi:osomolarity two-component system response regulator SSK1